MSATVIVLAEYREHKARIEVQCDPFAIWNAWASFWLGSRRTEVVSGVVRAIGSR